MNVVDMFLPTDCPRISDKGYFFDFMVSFFSTVLDQLSTPVRFIE